MRNIFLLKLFFLFVCCQCLIAQDFPAVPNPPRLVNDFAGFLDADKNNLLNKQLEAIDANIKIQIAVVSIDNIGEYDIGDYANQLGRKWGIGNKETNAGLLILIVKQNHKIWFSTGYGLEGIFPDIVCQKIIRADIKPFFKEGKFYEGLQSSLVSIMQILQKNDDGKNAAITKFYADFLEGNLAYKTAHQNVQTELSVWQVLLIIVMIIIALIVSSFSRGRRGMFIGTGIGSAFGGGFGGGDSSGGSGFGGFGGGSFGGGGSGGSW